MNNDDLNEIIYYGMKKILDESNLKDLLWLNLKLMKMR